MLQEIIVVLLLFIEVSDLLFADDQSLRRAKDLFLDNFSSLPAL